MLPKHILALVCLAACRPNQAQSVDSVAVRPPADTPSSPGAQHLVPGVWQDSPSEASGWSDAYQFFADGRYIYNYSQMDCSKREMSHSGHWTLKDSLLTLTIESRRMLVGGHMEESYGSCGTDSALADADTTVIVLSPALSHSVSFAGVDTVTTDVMDYSGTKKMPVPRIMIDGASFWLMKPDPLAY